MRGRDYTCAHGRPDLLKENIPGPAAGLLHAARLRGAATFVNSLDPPENLAPEDAFFPGRAAVVVPELVEDLCTRLGI